MDWSILILTQPSRARFLARLMAVLKPQVENHSNIEICVQSFNFGSFLGENRQAMIDEAKGKYCCFIDDDDLVPGHYVKTILPLLNGVDYIGFQLQMFVDGSKQKPTFHSLRYPQWNADSEGWYRDISHVNPIRRELALEARMAGGFGEDQRWADRLRATGKVKTETYIDDVMYFYYYRSDKNGDGMNVPTITSSSNPIKPNPVVPCQRCRSTATGFAGGMRRCNQCGYSWI